MFTFDVIYISIFYGPSFDQFLCHIMFWQVNDIV